MPPILEEKKVEYSALIVALLYIVKTLRNKEITRIEFSESLDYYHYLDPNFKKTDDSFDETNVLDILEFRNKYENQFIITIIYLCFLNCIHIVGSNIDSSIYEIFNNAEFFLLLIRVSIKKTQGLFTNLQAPQHSSLWNSILSFVNINQTLTGLYADLKGIIVKVHSIIFKEILLSKITDDYIINLLFTSKTATPTDNITNFSNHVNEIMKYFAISKIKNESAEQNKPVTEEIIKTYKKMNKFLFPMFPNKMKFVYGSSGGKITGGGSSEIINIFELTCNTFNINHTKMLPFIKKLYNESISYRNNGLTSKQPLITGLTSNERKALQPNVFNNFSTRRISTYSGGKRKSMKKYRGGVVVAGAVAGLSLAPGAAVYVTTASLNAFTAAGGTGLVAAGGISTLNGASVTLVTVGTAGVSAVAAPLLLVAGAVLVGVTVYSFSGTSKTQQEQQQEQEQEQEQPRLGQKDTLEQEQTLEQENKQRLEQQQRLEQTRQRRQKLDQQNKKRLEKEHQEKLDEIVKKEIEEQNEKKLDEIIDKELEQQKEEKIEKERQKLKDFNEFLKKAKNDAETTSDAVTYGSELALDPKIIRTINFIKSLEKQQIDDGIVGAVPNIDWGQKVILDTPISNLNTQLAAPQATQPNSIMVNASIGLIAILLFTGVVYSVRKQVSNTKKTQRTNEHEHERFDELLSLAVNQNDQAVLAVNQNDQAVNRNKKNNHLQHDSQSNKNTQSNKNESSKLATMELEHGGYRRYNKTKKNKRNKKR
jgi:hypothetical protein